MIKELTKKQFILFYDDLFSVTHSGKEGLSFRKLGERVFLTINKDSTIDFKEFQYLMFFHSEASEEVKKTFIYKLHDLDDGGDVDWKEFRTVARLMRGKDDKKQSKELEEQIKSEFKEKAGSDRKISKAEFLASSYSTSCEMYKLLIHAKVRRKMGFTTKPHGTDEIMQRTGFTKAQVQILQRKFNRIAFRSKLGRITGEAPYISRERFIDYYVDFFHTHHKSGNPTPFASLVFDSIDDGEDEIAKIEFHEFANLIRLHVNASDEERKLWIYNLHDLDESGIIEEKEFVDVARCMKGTIGYFTEEDKKKTIDEFRKIAGENNSIEKDEFLQSDYVTNCAIFKSLTSNPLFQPLA
ncbi:Oidioi.mRNA.OKI2018_I69.chr2.g5510.t1.cds [Oikopleura dioica]|uniref:Oidioi.mRNA.OKI2018_I69.chr2.g5510.t1.cds n=1 Tax=Oikopleura dioica TaxID=34765 RepID=A0ABN7T672_OIKDI|nr:Oidioi.mRNA.OKI2018_I69.chr2.g5510.t1.cds [Oikopleura dioica]